jgi:hypothetical protein
VGKQLEILALILLRNSFKELVHFAEPVVVTELDPPLRILADGIGALAIFVLLGFYYRLQGVRKEIKDPGHRYRFVAWKKVDSRSLGGRRSPVRRCRRQGCAAGGRAR